MSARYASAQYLLRLAVLVSFPPVFGLLSSAAPVPAWGATIEVTPGGPLTIQAAIDAAADGDSILLVGTPVTPFSGPGNRDIDVRGKALVITGVGSDPVIDCQGSYEEPHRGFLLQHGEGPSTVIEHLTVTNAQSPVGENGGALLCTGSSPEIVSCQFLGNHSSGTGNAIFSYGGSPRIADCVAERGSGAFVSPPGLSGAIVCVYGSPVIENCTVRSNMSGGVSVAGNGAPLVRGCLMAGNANGELSGSGVFENCTIRGNALENPIEMEANAVSLFGGASVLRDCRISGNHGFYPAVNAAGESVRLERCVIDGNAGGVVIRTSGELDHCVITGNGNTPSFMYFGALQVEGPYLCHVTNCTIVGNVSSAVAGGIHVVDASVEITHTIVQGNCSIYGDDVLLNEGGTVSFFCSDFSPDLISGPWADLGCNLNEDARFCDPFECAEAPAVGGDYQLDALSPCRADASPCHELIGALEVGCGATATQPMSWGAVKGVFR